MTRSSKQPSSRRSREHALMVLFEADVRNRDPLAVMSDEDSAHASIVNTTDDAQEARAVRIGSFAQRLIEGVVDQRAKIDEAISLHARGWQLHRMPAVDRTILRMATFELFDGHASPAVVINEAVELAKGYSTADSGRYVNGVLESIRKAITTTPVSDEPEVDDPAATA